MIDLLAAAVRGETRALETLVADDGSGESRALAAAEHHGVLPLIADRLAAAGLADTPVGGQFREASIRHAAADVVRDRELVRLLGIFRKAELPVLLFKGAHLAYTVYQRPDLRPRVDTDVLVDERGRGRAGAILEHSGYQAVEQAGGDLVSYQAPYLRRRANTIVHRVDLHWRVANPQAFGHVGAFDTLVARGTRVSALAHTLVPDAAHGLALSCVHAVAHHASHERLVWLYDMDLLARDLDNASWRRWLKAVGDWQIGAVCGARLRRLVEVFATPVPEWVLGDPALSADATEPSAAFLRPDRRHAATVAQDFSLLPSWTARSRLVRQHVLPSGHYMRTIYAPDSRAPLPWLYVARAVRGARRWLSRA